MTFRYDRDRGFWIISSGSQTLYMGSIKPWSSPALMRFLLEIKITAP